MINRKDVIGCGALNIDLIYEIEKIESLRPFFPFVESGGEYFIDGEENFSSLQAAFKKNGTTAPRRKSQYRLETR